MHYSLKAVFLYWSSLAMTLLFMALEVTLCTTAITQLPNHESNLIAFGVITSIAFLLQSPVLRILSAPLLFVKDSQSYEKLKSFTIIAGFTTSCIFIFITLPPVFNQTILKLVKLSSEQAQLVQAGLLFWASLPLGTALRRFYQGLSLVMLEPKKIASGTIIRLFVVITALIFLTNFTNLEGVYVAVLSICFGMYSEYFVSNLFARNATRKFLSIPYNPLEKQLNYRQICNIFFPLALATIIANLSRTILVTLITYSIFATESLVLYPVLMALVAPFSWSAYAIQDTTHSILAKDMTALKNIKQVTLSIGLIFTIILLFFSIEPLFTFYFKAFNNLSPTVLGICLPAVVILAFFPFTSVYKSFYRGYAIANHKTKILVYSELIEVFVTSLLFLVLIASTNLSGITIAMTVLVLGSLLSTMYIKLSLRTSMS